MQLNRYGLFYLLNVSYSHYIRNKSSYVDIRVIHAKLTLCSVALRQCVCMSLVNSEIRGTFIFDIIKKVVLGFDLD